MDLTRKKGNFAQPLTDQQQYQIQTNQQPYQLLTREEMQQQLQQYQQFPHGQQQLKSPIQNYQLVNKNFNTSQQQQQQQQFQQNILANSNNEINCQEYFSTYQPPTRNSSQTHRQLISQVPVKVSTPKSQPIILNNQRAILQHQKSGSSKNIKTQTNLPSNSGMVIQNSAFQGNQGIKMRPHTATTHMTVKNIQPDTEAYSNYQQIDQMQLQQQQQQKQGDQQYDQANYQEFHHRQSSQQGNTFIPPKYASYQSIHNQNFQGNLNTEGSDISTYQMAQCQQSQQPFQSTIQQSHEIFKSAQGVTPSKPQISQQQVSTQSFSISNNPKPPLQNVTKILKLLDFLMQKNQFDEALKIFWEYLKNASVFNQLISGFSEVFQERNKLFVYASRFYSYLSQGQTNAHSTQGGFTMQNFPTPQFSPSQSVQQFNLGTNTSTFYQGNLNFMDTISLHKNYYSSNGFDNIYGIQKPSKNQYDITQMMEAFQVCMEKIIEENENYKQQYAFKYPQTNQIVFTQKVAYLNNLAVYNMKKDNYALSFDQFNLIEKYSRLSSSNSQKNEQIKSLIIQPSILNNVALACILLEDWNQAEVLLQKSIGLQEVKVFPNMKNIEMRYLQEDQQFLSDVSVLVFGYVYAELVKRVKQQLKLPLITPADTFFIKNAMSITRKYFGIEHTFNRKIQAISKILDTSILCSSQSQQHPQIAPYSLQQADDPDLFDSQTLGQSNIGINNMTTTSNNNIFGVNPTSTQQLLPCVFLILKECEYELNYNQILEYRRYIKFRRSYFDKELSLWKQSILDFNSQNNYYLGMNQSSTRITTEASSQQLAAKKIFQANSQNNQFSQMDLQNIKRDDKNQNTFDKRPQSNSSLPNKDFYVSQNGTNMYFISGHHLQQQQGRQSSRKKTTNQSQSNHQQNQSAMTSSSQSHLQHRQYYHSNLQGDKQQYRQNNEGSKKSLSRPASSIKKHNRITTSESLQDPIDQFGEYYESEDQEQVDEEIEEDYGGPNQSKQQKNEEFSKNKQIKEDIQNKNNQNAQGSQQDTLSKKINSKRIQSEYLLKKEHEKEGTKENQNNDIKVPQDKLSSLDDNIKNMIIKVINQNEQIKKEKQSSAVEITQLKSLINSLIEQQKQNTTQLQQQQQQLIENQMKQMQKLEKKRTDSENSNKNQNNSDNNSGNSLNDNKKNGNKNIKGTNKQQDAYESQPRSPFYSIQSPIQPQLPILQLLNILQDCPFESFSLSKQVYPDGITPYTITCNLFKSGQLEIKAENKNNQVVATEQIFKDQLKELLQRLNYSPILPINLSLNMCQNIYLFNKCFILPFTSFDPEQNEIKFLSNAPGLLSQVHEKTFLGEQMVTFFHHIEGNTFRILLTRISKGDCIKIDLDLDSGSQKKWMEWINENEFPKEEITQILGFTKESLNQRHELIKEMQQRNLYMEAINKHVPKTNCDTKLKSYKIINETALVKELDDIIDQIQELFITHQIKDMNTLLASPYFLRVRIWSLALKRQIHLCIDNPNFIPSVKPAAGQINKASDFGEIKIILKNIYITFGPGGEKLKAQGVSSYSYYQVQAMYNVRYQILHLSEKVCILSHLPEYFTLNVHEKMDESLMNAKSTRQSENPIIKNLHLSGAYTRLLYTYQPNNSPKQEYMYPITLEAIGANNKFFGIRVSIYNYNTGKENGFFLSAEDNFWFFENKILIKNSHHMYLEGLPLSQFLISHIFEEVVAPLILKHVTVYEDPNSNQNELYLKLNKGLITQNSTSIYRIENIINVNEIIKNAEYIYSKNPQ
ncbi:hypothetical protein ABPG72_021008 [Tetrahymena utriculariae]